ncbi:MAG: RidA family protein [Acidiferrobacterales bacterium]|nr:RidA family protein [Acidiferrobacterales bacterium]
MSIKSYNPDGVWKPFGAFSIAVAQGSGKIVHLKGQVSLDEQGNIVGEGNIEAQVEKVLENMQAVLSSFGGRMEDLYTLTHHVTNIEAFMRTGHIRTRYFQPPYPVTTTVEVSRLYHPALMVEITGSAEIPLDRYKEPNSDESN